jgi:hypothetical protein
MHGALRGAGACLVAGGAGQAAQERTVVADDGHLSAVHPQVDALSGEFVSDVELPARRDMTRVRLFAIIV